MHRYLIYFGYSGTRFQGLQKLQKRVPPDLMTAEYLKNDEKSVQGALETAIFTKLKPANPVVLYSSSRTDVGVHAIANTGHIDLVKSTKDSYYDPKVITGLLNLYFRERSLDITVMKTLAVPGWFSARHDAVSRTYLYRLAVAKRHPDHNHHYVPVVTKAVKMKRNNWRWNKRNKLKEAGDIAGFSFSSVTPLLTATDHDNILVVRHAFQPELFEKALSQMVGTHNFASFCNAQGFYKYIKTESGEHIVEKRDLESLTKTVDSIEVSSHSPWLPSSLDHNYDHLDFYNVVIRGRSFLHNQVRRMIGVALSVSSGKLPPECVVDLLQNPSTTDKPKYPASALPAPPHGLYLANVGYNEAAVHFATEDVSKLPLGPSLCPRDDFDWVLGPGYIPDHADGGLPSTSNTRDASPNFFFV